MGPLGSTTPKRMDEFLNEAAALVGQWDAVCCALEAGREPRSALQDVSTTILALKRSNRAIECELFSKTLSVLGEYLRLVLKLDPLPIADALPTLMTSQSIFFRWLMGLRMGSPPDEDLAALRETIASHNDAMYQVLEEQKLRESTLATPIDRTSAVEKPKPVEADKTTSRLEISQEWSVPTSLEMASSIEADQEADVTPEAPNESLTDKDQFRSKQPDVIAEKTNIVSDEIYELVAQIFMQQGYLEHLIQKDDHPKRDLLRMIARHSRMISSMVGKIVSLQLVKTETFFDQLSYFLQESARARGVLVSCECDVEGLELEAETLEALWEPMSQILCKIIEVTSERTQERDSSVRLRIRGRSEGASVRFSITCPFPDPTVFKSVLDRVPVAETALSLSKMAGGTLHLSLEAEQVCQLNFVVPLSKRFPEIVFLSSGGELFAVHRHVMRDVIEREAFNSYAFQGDQRVIEVGGGIFPFTSFSDLFDMGAPLSINSPVDVHCGQAILVQFGNDTIALGVDEISTPARMIVKPLQKHLERVPGLCGTVVAGDGSPVPVIDVVGLVGIHLAKRRMKVAA
ncbi:MAG: hypothetical protein RIR26_153 [Pseudomonadota bacterium]